MLISYDCSLGLNDKIKGQIHLDYDCSLGSHDKMEGQINID